MMHPYRMSSPVDAEPQAAKPPEPPPLAANWLGPSCPRCGATWFKNVRFIVDCEVGRECSIVRSNHRHAHYHCQSCEQPFWTTFSADPNDP